MVNKRNRVNTHMTDAAFDKAKLQGETSAQPDVKPTCAGCGETMMVSVSSSNGRKVHPHCKHNYELGVEAARRRDALAADMADAVAQSFETRLGFNVENWLKRPRYSRPYDWEARGDSEDNGPAHQHPEGY